MAKRRRSRRRMTLHSPFFRLSCIPKTHSVDFLRSATAVCQAKLRGKSSDVVQAYARVKLGREKRFALPLPLRLVDRVANEVSTHVGWALLPVQVTDVGQEWPTDSKIDSPAANLRGSQDVTNTALQNGTTSAPGEAARFGPASACSGSNVSAVSQSRSSRQHSVVDSATDLAFGDCPAIRCSENRAGSR